jgi:hypothetical protein
MTFNKETLDEIKSRGIEVTEEELAEFDRQNINSDDDIELAGEDVSLSNTTARVHIAALDDTVLQEHLRRSLQFVNLEFEEQSEISASIYIASIKRIPIDKKLMYIQLTKLYEKKFFKSIRYFLASQKTRADAATAYMVGTFNRTAR